MNPTIAALARAALPHVPFDGWSEATFRAACADAGVDPALARVHCSRGAVDLALAVHELGDQELRERLAGMDLSNQRFRDRVVTAVMLRLEVAGDRESVRRAAALFALPTNTAAGARAIWGTADTIWTALGDRSDDLNWYSKRAILSGVYSAAVLYWLGDDSTDAAATREFVTRRIADVMRIETTKAKLRANPLTAPLMAAQARFAGRFKAPADAAPQGASTPDTA